VQHSAINKKKSYLKFKMLLWGGKPKFTTSPKEAEVLESGMDYRAGHRAETPKKRHRILSQSGYFAKQYEEREAAEAEFSRTAGIYDALQRKRNLCVRTAHPIRIVGNTVYFEKITGCVDLRKLVCRLRIDSRLLDILYKTGRALAQLHLALNPEMKSLDKHVHIHGDFHLSNVLYSLSEDVAYMIDFAPPGFNQRKCYCYGSIYHDLAWMILTIEVKYPPHKIYLLARKDNERLSNSFIKGYEDAVGMKVDERKLAKYLKKALTRLMQNVQRKNVFSRLFWTWQCKRAIEAHGCDKE